MLQHLGCEVLVARNDAVSVAEVRAMQPAAIVLSPGPCTPREAGCSLDLVRCFGNRWPILGVCLGHQAIAAAYGGPIVRTEPVHGRASAIYHDGRGIFEGVPSPFQACRYHSLAADRAALPAQLEVCGETEHGLIMAVRHRQYRVAGVQFHPESILTQYGYTILANFLRWGGIACGGTLPSVDDELTSKDKAQ